MNPLAKILVVDDDPDFLDSARSMLESGSYRVSGAFGEEEALIQIETERPDLLILDVMMSRRDSGFQLLWKLKEDECYKSIPILIVTGVDKEVHMGFARHAERGAPDEQGYLPVEGYLVKPLTTSTLLSSVKRILGRSEKVSPR